MSAELAYASLTRLVELRRRGDLGAVELLDYYAARIDRLADVSKAFITLDLERAREAAVQHDTGPGKKPRLSGIPYACKDLFDVAGLATTAGSRVLQDNIADTDAAAIARLNAAGALLIGKNNLHEFAYGATGENEIYGTPPNPYDHRRLCGGSSSGSAAALAYDLCAFALGTDTGGSVRAPAALCGLVGFKPTFGRVSRDGVIPYSWSLDHVGSFTRSAADCELLFSVLADRHRPAVEPSLRGLRVGIPDRFFFERADAEILRATEGLIDFLRGAGVKLVQVELPSMEHTRTVSLTVQMPEALSYHNRYLEQRGELYGNDFRAGLALGQNLLAEQYVRAKRFIETYRRDLNRVFERVNLILTPATPAIAPEIGSVSVTTDGYTEPAGNAITRFTSFFNMTGHPALTLPCGQHSEGPPIGAQLVGRYCADEELLALAIRIEAEFAFKPALPNAP